MGAEGLEIEVAIRRDRTNDAVGERWMRALVPAGTNSIRNVQNVGTSSEAVALGDVTAGGYFAIMNLDTTNFVQLRQTTETALVRLEPLDFCLFRLDDSATLEAQADTSACELLVLGFDP